MSVNESVGPPVVFGARPPRSDGIPAVGAPVRGSGPGALTAGCRVSLRLSPTLSFTPVQDGNGWNDHTDPAKPKTTEVTLKLV